VLRPGPVGRQRVVGQRAGEQAGGREQDPAGVVGDLERHGGAGRHTGRLEQHGASRRPEVLGDVGQLTGHHVAEQGVGLDDPGQLRDGVAQRLLLGLQLEAGEPGEPAQRHLEDVVGLRLRQVEDRHQPLAGRGRVVAGPDHLDDLVDVQDGDEQPVDEVQPLLGLRAPVQAAATYDVEAVRDVDLEQVLEAERAGLAVDQRHVVDPEGLLERRQLVELVEDRLGVEAVLDLDDQPQAHGAVGVVVDGRDALQLLAADQLGDLLLDALGADTPRQLGDDDALAARGDVLDPRGRPGAEGPAAGLVGLADAVEADDLAAGGQVRAGDEAHQRVQVGLGVLEQVTCRGDDLDQVVRRHVGRHADCDAGRAVDQQIGEGGRQDLRLELAVVVVGPQVDDLFVDAGRHRHGGRCEAALGVAVGRGRVVVAQRPEVAVPVDQRQPQRPGLRHPDQRVVDRGVAVRVQRGHHVADHSGALHVAAVGPQPHLGHPEEDPPVHRLEPVTRVGQRAAVDDRVGVLEEGPLHLVGDVDVGDLLGEVAVRRGRRLGPAGHGECSWCGEAAAVGRTPEQRSDGRSGR